MPVTEHGCSDVQGRMFDVDDVGTRLVLGRNTREAIIALPVGNTTKLFFTLGQAGLLEDPDNSEANLKSKYPALQNAEIFNLFNGSQHPQTLEFRCAAGDSISDVSVKFI